MGRLAFSIQIKYGKCVCKITVSFVQFCTSDGQGTFFSMNDLWNSIIFFNFLQISRGN